MAFIVKDRVKETTTVTGTGAATLLGASAQFKAFSAVCANADLAPYAIVGQTGTEWEVGIGTWGTGNILTRTTVISSSNADAAVTFSAGTKDVFLTIPAKIADPLDNNNVCVLPATTISAVPTPAADTIGIFARKISGRMMPKWISPSGVDNPMQAALFGNNIAMYLPYSSTNGGTATLGGLGMSWTASGTVSHPTPASTAPAIANQMHRTRYANIVATTNQTLGIIATAAGLPQFWRGNAAGLGGFFFSARIILELVASTTTIRLFAGLTSLATAMTAADTPTGDFCGFHHETVDGANVINFVTRNDTTTTKAAITGAVLAVGQAYDLYIYCAPNGGTIFYRVDDLNAGTTLVDTSTTTTIPTATAFMGPQITMSNGTANTTVTTVALGIVRAYVESDH